MLAAGRSGNWDTELAVAAGTAEAYQKQMAAGVFPRRSRRKASSPAAVAADAAGIAGVRWAALGRWEGKEDADPRANRRRMFLVLGDDRM